MIAPPVRRLLSYVLRYRQSFLLGLGCVVVSTAVGLMAPWVLKHAVDDLSNGVTTTKLVSYAALLLSIALVGGLFRFLMRRIIVGLSRHVEYDLRNDFFAQLEQQPPAYFHVHRTGDLMSRATNDLNAVRMMIGPAVMYTANTLIVFVVALGLMFSLDWWLTLIALLPMPFVSVSVKYFGGAIHKRFESIQAQLSNLSAVAQEALAGVRVVRAYRQEQAELARFEAANREYVTRNVRLIRLQGLFFPSMSLFLGLGGLLVLWLGSREVIRGRLTVGEFVALNAYLAMLSWPMIAFGWVTNMLQRGMASWKRMLEVMAAEPSITDEGTAASGADLPPIRGGIEFRHLSFRYGDTEVLSDVSIQVDAGQTLAVVGHTGSGKSTLINLLPRLYDPPRGTVFIDGVDIREIPLSTLRAAIGFVPQEAFLFSDSIRENVAFGIPEASATAVADPIAAAAAVARLDVDVAGFPDRYETLVGERGITLSGGQKQRTAIARAVATNPRILILDDALSAVDTYTEEEILKRLRAVMRTRTSIIVSHRVSTVREADLIVVLEGGRIVERGRHAELVAADGHYADLYRKQLLEEELAGV